MWVGRLWVPPLPDVEGDEEVCGVILGRKRKWRLIGRQIVMLPNQADDPVNHYRMEVPADLVPDLVATYHTHSAAEAILGPSDHDRAVSTRMGLYGLVRGPDGACVGYQGKYTSPTAFCSPGTARKPLYRKV